MPTSNFAPPAHVSTPSASCCPSADADRHTVELLQRLDEAQQAWDRHLAEVQQQIHRATDSLLGTFVAMLGELDVVVHAGDEPGDIGTDDAALHLQRRASQVGRCGRHVREHVQQVMVDLQFQDRVDQVLDQVRNAMGRSLAQLQRDLPHGRVPARAAWRASLTEGYTTAEQLRAGAEASAEPARGPVPGEAVFF